MQEILKNLPKKINVNLYFKLAMGFMLIVLVALDLGSKFYAQDILIHGPINVINGFFNFALAYNTGVSFSMFNNLASGAIILAVIAITAGIFLELLAVFSIRKIETFSYTLIAAGAYGNGIDRLLNGHVIDFLDFYYKNWHYPTFNFADCFIFIGVAIILLESVFNKKTNKN